MIGIASWGVLRERELLSRGGAIVSVESKVCPSHLLNPFHFVAYAYAHLHACFLQSHMHTCTSSSANFQSRIICTCLHFLALFCLTLLPQRLPASPTCVGLDNNHDVFFFLDNDTEGKFGQETSLRSDFERQITKTKYTTKSRKTASFWLRIVITQPSFVSRVFENQRKFVCIHARNIASNPHASELMIDFIFSPCRPSTASL